MSSPSLPADRDFLDSSCPACGQRIGAHKAMPEWSGRGCPPKDKKTCAHRNFVTTTERGVWFCLDCEQTINEDFTVKSETPVNPLKVGDKIQLIGVDVGSGPQDGVGTVMEAGTEPKS